MSKGFSWIDRTLIRSPYHISLCTTEKGFHAVLKKLKVPEKDWPEFVTEDIGACVQIFEYDQHLFAVVNMEKSKRPVEEIYSTLTHEAVHIFQHIREFIGEQYPSVEFEAYSIQNISQNLMESYKRQTSTKKGTK